jgi:hypothetical protein
MPVEIRFKIDDRGTKALLKDRRLVGEPLRTYLSRSSKKVLSEAQNRAPVFTGRLRSSLQVKMKTDKMTVISTSPYALYVETGTRPHFPPISAIRSWAQSKGINPYALARSIARKGTKPTWFLRDSFEFSQRAIKGYLADAARDIEARWRRG